MPIFSNLPGSVPWSSIAEIDLMWFMSCAPVGCEQAYRLEPLILKHYETLMPVRIHRWDSPHKPAYDTLPLVAYDALKSKGPTSKHAKDDITEKAEIGEKESPRKETKVQKMRVESGEPRNQAKSGSKWGVIVSVICYSLVYVSFWHAWHRWVRTTVLYFILCTTVLCWSHCWSHNWFIIVSPIQKSGILCICHCYAAFAANLDANQFSVPSGSLPSHESASFIWFFVCPVNSRVLSWPFSNLHHAQCSLPWSFIFGLWGAIFVFLVCALHPLVFNGSFLNWHQIFIWSWSRPQYILATEQNFQHIFFKFTPNKHGTKM